MKVVINACHGGFGLSDEAVELYCKLKGQQVWYVPDPKYGTLDIGTYWVVPPADRPKEIKNWNKATMAKRIAYNEAYSKATLSPRDLDRADPFLVQAVEQLGDKANGRFAELKVVDIPDGTDYTIEEYDGAEWVAEKHETWS